MSTVKGLRAGVAAGILAGMALLTGAVRANAQDQFSTERPGSILIFPKVINTTTGTVDPGTIIQISNTTNIPVFAECFYVDGRSVNGSPIWQVTDFDLALTRQQPTHWDVALGRAVNPFDNEQGLDPGLIPPVSPGFTGFLTCVQTDVGGTPVGGNALKGEATTGVISGVGGVNNVSKYNAIAIPAVGTVAATNVLSLDGIEYAACPRDLLFNFQAEGGPDPALEGAGNTASIVSSNLTLVPCGMDFENLIPVSTTLTANPVRDEFETNLSVSSAIPVDCWFSEDLAAPVFGGPLGSPFVSGTSTEFGTSIISPDAPSQAPALGVVNVLRIADDGTSDTAASNLFWDIPTGPACEATACLPTCTSCKSEIRLPTP